MKPIKVGIIGTGFSAGFHIESLRRVPGIEIIAISGSSADKARDMAEKHGIPRHYGNYGALISDPDIEVIHNCTPNYLHYDINKAVMLAGKDLLSEKPLAVNSSQTAELAELARTSGTISGVCFNYRHFPMVMQTRSMLCSGEYGSPHLVMGSYLQDWLLHASDYSWRLDPALNGASRAVADIGSHWCDTVEFVLCRRIVEVFADLQTIHPVRQKPLQAASTFGTAAGEQFEEIAVATEDSGSILVRFEGGLSGVFTVSQVSAGRKNKLQFEISASGATLYWDQENPNKLWEGRRDEANGERLRDPSLLAPGAAEYAHFPGGHEEGWPDGMKNLMLDFYREVKHLRRGQEANGEPQFATIEDGHHIMQVVEAILKSNETRQWVRVQDV